MLIVTAASKDYWPLLELTAPNKLEYCLRHGAKLLMHQHPNGSEIVSYDRLSLILHALDLCEENEWLWFMGADTLITNMTINAEQMLGTETLRIGLDINGINNDSFFLRNNKQARTTIQRCLYRVAMEDEPTCQSAMNTEILLGKISTRAVSQREFNSFLYNEYSYGAYPEGTWQPGDLVLHVPGLPMERRMELVREYLAKVVR